MKLMKHSWSQVVVYTISVFLLILITLSLIKYFGRPGVDDLSYRLEERPLDIIFGDDSAKLSIYMYSSYSCTYCNLFFNEGYPQLKEEYIDKGKLKLIMRLTVKTNNIDLLNSLKTAVCINRFGNFEYLHRLLLNNHKVVYTNDFREMVEEFIDKDILVAECVLGGESEEYLKQNLDDFEAFEMKGTPTFIIGNKIYSGYKDYPTFKKIINDHLK